MFVQYEIHDRASTLGTGVYWASGKRISTTYEVRGLKEKTGSVDIITRKDTDAKIKGNESELHSVCVNLLSNAVRYSNDGDRVEIRWHEVEPGKVARLSVTDCGIGIAPEHIDRLTERFYRVDMSDARTRGGTGLGLAIVKHVLRRHDSMLHIKSKLGEGSEFYCDFFVANPLSNATVH